MFKSIGTAKALLSSHFSSRLHMHMLVFMPDNVDSCRCIALSWNRAVPSRNVFADEAKCISGRRGSPSLHPNLVTCLICQ